MKGHARECLGDFSQQSKPCLTRLVEVAIGGSLQQEVLVGDLEHRGEGRPVLLLRSHSHNGLKAKLAALFKCLGQGHEFFESTY